jgi:protein tyrosine phosphatase (PTP) superfamily phosphohydrolase (DUF442 family)
MRQGGLAAFGVMLLALGLASAATSPRQDARPGPGRAEAEGPERLEIAGVENAFRLSPGLYSGSEPGGPEAFEALAALGIRTIITVDGATPDVEAARAAGLRYVHLPIGYDGVPREQAVRLVRAVTTLPGPVFVHCHHGMHRGPAAAALCGMATEGWSADRAVAWMEAAGTSPEYRGLFASAREFVPPTPRELEEAGDDLPERAEVPALVELMLEADARWSRLTAAREAGFRAPDGHPDVDPPHEALLLAEAFREMARRPEVAARGASFAGPVGEAERRALSLADALRDLRGGRTPGALDAAESAFRAAGRSCKDCHAAHRDR